jgi:GMP reductase
MVKIEEDIKLDFSDVLIKPKRSTLTSRREVSLDKTINFLHSKCSWVGVPIMVSNMDSVGTFDMFNAAKDYRLITTIHKHYSVDEWSSWYKSISGLSYSLSESEITLQYIAVSTGISDADFYKTKNIFAACPKLSMIVIDVANGYMEAFVTAVKKYRNEFPDKIIFAGNVCTSEMTEALILAGADVVKVGIGSGAVCTTRKQTGVGMPQLSAVLECADAAHKLGGHIVSDGGIQVPGDFAKAFGGGADFVMAGGIFSGTVESEGDIIEENGQQYKIFYGMSSKKAMAKYSGGIDLYRSAEGKCVKVLCKGSVNYIIRDFLGGLRSACSYVGASELKELSDRTTFVRVSRQSNNIFSAEQQVVEPQAFQCWNIRYNSPIL